MDYSWGEPRAAVSPETSAKTNGHVSLAEALAFDDTIENTGERPVRPSQNNGIWTQSRSPGVN